MDKESKQKTLLNGVCPYFTMFPLDFPYLILREHAELSDWVLDPFCGRGTTNYASRILGLSSIGIDSSPVAATISQAKLANTTPEDIVTAANSILNSIKEPSDIPSGEFWDLAFHPEVLHKICRLRQGLMTNCSEDARWALRAIIIGALHGPRKKIGSSYFSNQCQRTYAPKPGYAVKFWKTRNLNPEKVDVLEIIGQRARRYFSGQTPATGKIICGDSRDKNIYSSIVHQVKWVITSPPYYGLKTYLPDQWLRMWFLGGSSTVDYSNQAQLEHSSVANFTRELNQVWKNVGNICQRKAKMVIRFGVINERVVNPLQIIKSSLENSGWNVEKVESAGFASQGLRQANHIRRNLKSPHEEYDIWATWRD